MEEIHDFIPAAGYAGLGHCRSRALHVILTGKSSPGGEELVALAEATFEALLVVERAVMALDWALTFHLPANEVAGLWQRYGIPRNLARAGWFVNEHACEEDESEGEQP